MFQLWSLVLLCGLLTGTSAALLENVGSGLTDVSNNVQHALGTGLGAVGNNVLTGALPELKSTLGNLLKDLSKSAGGLFTAQNGIGLKISDLAVLDIKSEMSKDGNRLNLKIPITAKVSLSLPLIGQVANALVSLDLLNILSFGRDEKTNLPTMALAQCTSDPANFSVSLLNRRVRLINVIVDNVVDTVKRTVTGLLETLVCPVIDNFVRTVGVDFLQGTLSTVQQAVPL